MKGFEFKLSGWCKDINGNIMEFTEDQVVSFTLIDGGSGEA